MVYGLLRSVVDSCGHCGRAVSSPVKLTDLSRSPVEETYYACPFCFSRLNIEDMSEHLEHSHSDGLSPLSSVEVLGLQREKRIEKKVTTEAVSNCSHEFGYLGNRPKDAGIPDDCLVCPRILQCMAKST